MPTADSLWFRSGIRQEHSLVGDTSADLCDVADVGGSSSIIEDTKSIHSTGLALVAYYYFDFKDTRKQDRRGLLSSLLTQLCTQSHHSYDILSSLHQAHEKGSRQPKEVDLIRCLKDVLSFSGHGRVYIIVDAIDESPNNPGIPSPREKVLQLVKDLVDVRHPDIRVCITSRPEVESERSLNLWHLTPCLSTMSVAKGAILSTTSSRLLSRMRTCGNGGQKTGKW